MTETEPMKLGEDQGGELWGVPVPYTDKKALSSAFGQTPNTEQSRSRGEDETGPVRRHSGGLWSKVDLKTFSLNSAELSTTLKKFRDEMYRNQFPVLTERWKVKCTECGATYDEEVDQCEGCGATDFVEPSQSQKRKAKEFFEEVNGEGQSLRSLMKYEEDYQSFYGISTVIVRKQYSPRERSVRVLGHEVNRTQKIETDDIELVHADPMAVLPVTDENNRHGGWWTCPIHRDEYWETDELEFDDGECVSTCPECGTRLHEVGYAETDGRRGDDVENLFLKDEVIDWARHFPQMSGLDGRSPIMPLVKLQALIQFNRNYDLAYFDPSNDDQLPNKMVLAYGQNIKQSLSASLEEDSNRDVWETGKVMYEGDPDDVEIDVVDLTPQDALQGRDRMVERLQSQIRAMFGVTDAMENELSDTGGLNAEGTQIEITNRAVASAQQDTKDMALESIARSIGLTDWEIKYVDPKRERHELNPNQKIAAMQNARRESIPYTVEDGQLMLLDHDYKPDEDAESESDDSRDDDPIFDEPED